MVIQRNIKKQIITEMKLAILKIFTPSRHELIKKKSAKEINDYSPEDSKLIRYLKYKCFYYYYLNHY